MKYKLVFLAILTICIFVSFNGCSEKNNLFNSLDFSTQNSDDYTYAFIPQDDVKEFEFSIESVDETMGQNKQELDLPLLEDSATVAEMMTVWIPQSGKKYHSNPDCSNMKSPKEVDVSSAISQGYEPCKRCYK